MKNVKKVLALLLAMVLVTGMLAACGSDGEGETETIVDADASQDSDGETIELKVGAILVGDETEGYTLAHMIGIEAAAEALAEEGINVTYAYKKSVPESDEVATNELYLNA